MNYIRINMNRFDEYKKLLQGIKYKELFSIIDSKINYRFLFYNLSALNIGCFYPLILHGKYRENTFIKRGSYNSAVKDLFPVTLVTIMSWHLSKRILKSEMFPKHNKLIAFGVFVLPASFMISNISMLTLQDSTIKTFNKNTSSLPVDSYENE